MDEGNIDEGCLVDDWKEVKKGGRGYIVDPGRLIPFRAEATLSTGEGIEYTLDLLTVQHTLAQ